MQSVTAKTGTASGFANIQNLAGWFISETAAAAAVVNIRAGGAAEAIIYRINIESSGDDDRTIVHPVDCVKAAGSDQTKNNWYVEVASGAVRWTLEGF